MLDPRNYTIGWICAITTEFVAAQAFLDEEHGKPKNVAQNDNNSYALGKIGEHNVVIAVMPKREYGTTSAATVARDMLHSFPNVRIGLMVGIGGGAPVKRDIRLGDIVVSSRDGGKGGVIQYDYGKAIQDQAFVETGSLNQPPQSLLVAVSALEARYEMKGHRLNDDVEMALKKIKKRKKYCQPPVADSLYRSSFKHPPNTSEGCSQACGDDPSHLIVRAERDEDQDNPAIHYGLIASANTLMKDALVRDKLAAEKDILCFEMEAAGLMNHFPCLVIRGICDYADTHKNQDWQGFAAMMAAAYAKDLLQEVAPQQVETEKKISEALLGISQNLQEVYKIKTTNQALKQKLRESDEYKECLKHLRCTDPCDDKERIEEEKGGLLKDSYRWVLKDPEFQTWREDNQSPLLWVKGEPGKGKTMLLCGIINELKSTLSNGTLSYFFCQATDSRINSAAAVLRGLIYMLVRQQPSLISHIQKEYDHAGEGLFENTNTWVALTKIFTNILHDSSLTSTYLVVDALDECVTDLQKLLDFIVKKVNTSPRVKWIVSSRNWPSIEKDLSTAMQKVRLCLELNEKSISGAVVTYIQFKVD